MSDDILLLDDSPATHRTSRPQGNFACIDALQELERVCAAVEHRMGRGMCMEDPPGHCEWFITPNAGFGNVCERCGHLESRHS